MLIRPVTQADARDLRRHCFAATSLDEIHDMIERFEAPPDSHLLVAETENGEAVATCTLARHRHRLCRHRAELSGFVIGSDWQGTGLARQIVHAARDLATIEWDTSILEVAARADSHAHHAYAGLGFTEWARLPGGYRDDGEIWDEVRLYLQL